MSSQYGIELGAGEIVSIGGTIPTLGVPWISANTNTGASNWWDEVGVVNSGGVTYYTNPNPDQGAGAQPNNSGARGCAYYTTGFTDVSVEVTWYGVYDGGSAGPIVCINPNDSKFGLTLYYEDFGAFWAYFLWNVGRQPDDITIAASAIAPAHTSGVPVVLRMDVVSNSVKCYVNGSLITLLNAGTGLSSTTYPVPSGLVGSTLHGISIDVNKNGPQPPAGSTEPEIIAWPYNRAGNLTVAAYPATIVEL
jgi:hypothetical protein